VSAADDAIFAALLWDRPALLRSSVAGARAFVDAFDPPPYRGDLEGEQAPLAIGAYAVELEVAGRTQEALQQYARLGQIEGLPSILAAFLLAWSSVPADEALLDGVVEQTRRLEIDSDYVRARLLAKLATYALDKGRADLFPDLLSEAADIAPWGSALRRALRISRANLVGTRLEEEDFEPLPDTDLLVDYPWIDDLALGSARAELNGVLKARAASPWSWTIHSGRTPLDEVLAALRQATWAGALWLRDPVRRQLAAQMLASGGNAYQTLYALTHWALAGGDDIRQVIDYSEPRFDGATAELLVAQIEAQTVVPRISGAVLPKVAVELWDLFSPETIDRLLEQLRPTGGDLAIDPEVRHFWGRAALVAPDVWQERVRALDADQRAALLETLPSAVLKSVDRDVARDFAAAGEAKETLSPAARAALIVIEHRLGRAVTLVEVPAWEHVAAEIYLRDTDVLSHTDYEQAELRLREKRAQEAEQARQGQMGFGGRSTAGDLSLVAQARGAIGEASVALLVREAADELLPSEFRLDSLIALSRVASVGLAAPEVPVIEELAQPHPMSFFMPMSFDLLRAARIAVHAKKLDADDQVSVVTLSRHPDARVRQIVVAAAGLFLAEEESASVESALLAGLYDPDEGVVSGSLSAVGRARLTDAARGAVTQRLGRLFEAYGRDVRAATVRAARARLNVGDDPQLAAIVERGAVDRSWQVRDAATEADDK
jgi:hypothetical protein